MLGALEQDVAVGGVTAPDGGADMLAAVRAITDNDLHPIVNQIDREGVYPDAVMRALGAAGAYSQHVGAEPRLDLATEAMAIVGEECLSTSFCMWCQNAMAWYLANTPNEALKSKMLRAVSTAALGAGTGLSNPMKNFFGIEKMRLKGVKADGGYVVSGTLPWVSNIGEDRYFGAIFGSDGGDGPPVMFCVDCSAPGVSLSQNASFTALEGTRTYAVKFKEHFVPDDMILADPAGEFVRDIRAGFILMQCGMAAGLIEGCLQIMRQTDKSHEHVNRFLPDRPDAIAEKLAALKEEVVILCQTPYETSDDYFRAVLKARLAGSDLSLVAAQAAMLHAGARGYLYEAPAQRRLRESYFVAIVTPASKQLAKMLHDMDA